jgi:hypothetical protein
VLRSLSPADQTALARIAEQLFEGQPDNDWMPSRSLR